MTFLESKRSTATKCLDHLTLNHIIYNKLIHCNTSLLRLVGALTGTADPKTRETIKNVLNLSENAEVIYVSPNWLNLRFSVQKLKKEQQLKKLDGLVDLVKKEGIITPKTIVFCNAMDEIAIVLNHLMSQLGKKVFFPNCLPVKDNCLIGIYHSNSWQSSKDRVMEQFKSCGVKRVIIATTALCMGVNFPDVCFIINWGPARSILDQHQEAGRAGRDGKRAHVVVINFIMGNKLDIMNNTSKILSILKAVFMLLRINLWMTQFNLWNLLVTAVLFVRQFASVLVKVVTQKLCLLQQLRTVTTIM